MLTGCFDFRYAIADDITRFSPPADASFQSQASADAEAAADIFADIFAFLPAIAAAEPDTLLRHAFASSPPSLRQRYYFRRLSLSPLPRPLPFSPFSFSLPPAMITHLADS
jgi:hypothetical protein